MPDQAFEQLRDRYYQAWFRYHPEEAVEVGVPGYADRLLPFSDDDIGALITLDEKLIDSLEELDLSALGEHQRVDARLMYHAAFVELEELLEHDWRRRDPERYLPLNAIYQLTIRDVENFSSALCGRLRAIPGHLLAAQRYLDDEPDAVPPVWLESAITGAETGTRYLRELIGHPRMQGLEPGAGNVKGLLNRAIEALEGFLRFLEADVAARAGGRFACGRRRFEHLLRSRHFLEVTADELHEFGRLLFERTRAELQQACLLLTGNRDVVALTEKIQSEHPGAVSLLDAYRGAMIEARNFVADRRLVTLPKLESLEVVHSPVFLRHAIPFAAYMEPAAQDPAQRGYYYVTPATDPDTLAEHNYAGLMHTCVHEAYPGHHLQFVTANLNPTARTLPRLLNRSATLYEGWALYCEQLMHEEGFLNRPEQAFILLKDRMWRALRVMIDVEIHMRDTTLNEASERMQQHLGFPASQAEADLTWYTRAPTTPMGYATGWSLINAARDCLQIDNAKFDLRDFHDRLLSCGSIALPLVLRQAFGEALAQQAQRMTFDLVPDAPANAGEPQ